MADNLTLGRGELRFAKFKPGTTTPGGERYIGNTPEFNLTIENENLDHFNSDHGVNEKDDSIVLSTNRTGSLTTDNIHPENLALFFLGSTKKVTVAAAVAEVDTFTDVEGGLYYQLGTSSANPSGVRKVTNVTVAVSGGGGGGAAPAAGDDYTIDLELAQIYIVPGGALEGKSISVTYDVSASTRQQIISGATAVEGSLRFVSFNPKGEKIDYFMPQVSITANGDYALKGDDWQAIPFTIEIKKKGDLAAIYADGRPFTS